MNLFYWKSQPPVGGKHFALYTKNKPVTVRKLVHVKTLHQLEENLRARIFQTVKSSTWSKSTTDKWRRTRIEKNGSQLKTWRLNGTECSHLTAKILTKDFLSKMFFIEDDRHSVGQISNQRRINPSLCCDPSKLDSRNLKVWTWGTLMDMKE
jgi:hypothetical protein